MLLAMAAWGDDGRADIVNRAEAVGTYAGRPVVSDTVSRNVPVSADRDADGIADAPAADPAGHFYCETDGRILPGGRIAVDNLDAGGSQDGAGSSHGITIDDDGGDGRYRFRVEAAGHYRLRYQLPPQGIASVERRPQAARDLSRLAGTARIGSGEAGQTGFLADPSATANPFHHEFVLAPGVVPAFIDNNIPLRYCGRPELAADLHVVAGPELQGDRRSRLTYRLTVTNSGDERVDEVQLRDDLAGVFGPQVEIVSVVLAAAPDGFGATVNPYFDGRSDTALLTSGGNLRPGEHVAIDLTVLAGAGSFRNAVTASGLSPLDASTLDPAGAAVATVLGEEGGAAALSAAIEAEPAVAAPGERIAVRLAVTGTERRNGAQLVVQLPPGLTFLAGTARLGRRASEPQRAGNALVWPSVLTDDGTAGNMPAALDLQIVLGAAAPGATFTVYGFARDADGAVLSDIAAATIRRDRDAIFTCAEIDGRVFDDRNRDGYVQAGEPGIAGAVISGPDGLKAISDREGRFSIPCPAIGVGRIGGEVRLQLDEASLPPGYRPTTPVLRAVQLARGKVSRLAFGAAAQRVVTHILEPQDFEPGSVRLRPDSLRALANLINLLEEEISLLRLTYVGEGDDRLAKQRAEAARALVADAWEARQRRYRLSIETRIVR